MCEREGKKWVRILVDDDNNDMDLPNDTKPIIIVLFEKIVIVFWFLDRDNLGNEFVVIVLLLLL